MKGFYDHLLLKGLLLFVFPVFPEEGAGSPGARGTDSCGPPHVGTQRQTWVLWRSSMCPQLLSHLCSPLHGHPAG